MSGTIQELVHAFLTGIGKSIMAEAFFAATNHEPTPGDMRRFTDLDYRQAGATWVFTNKNAIVAIQQVISYARGLVTPEDSSTARGVVAMALERGEFEWIFGQRGGAYLSKVLRDCVASDDEGQFLLTLDILAAIEH